MFYRLILTICLASVLTPAVFASSSGGQMIIPTAKVLPPISQTNGLKNDLVNINTATIKDLSKVKGLTVAKAKAILAYRKKHGEFKSLEQLADVRGFKKIKAPLLLKIKDQLAAA